MSKKTAKEITNKETVRISELLVWILKVSACLFGGSWLVFTGTEMHKISEPLNAGAIMIPIGILSVFWGLVGLLLCPPSHKK